MIKKFSNESVTSLSHKDKTFDYLLISLITIVKKFSTNFQQSFLCLPWKSSVFIRMNRVPFNFRFVEQLDRSFERIYGICTQNPPFSRQYSVPQTNLCFVTSHVHFFSYFPNISIINNNNNNLFSSPVETFSFNFID